MKKHSSLIMLICMIFLFTMCKKEFNLRNSDMGAYPRAATIYEWGFDTNGDLQGWTTGNATATVSGGTLNLTTTSSDPLIMSPDNLNMTAPATYKFIHVDMKNYSSVTSARIFFITNTDTTWSQAKSKGFTIKADSSYYASYIVDMSTVAGWSGTIKRIRIDPLDSGTTSGQQVKIDFIRITDNQSHRGVMSPGEGITAGDADTLKNIWKANVMRWQLYSGKNLSTLDSFDTWLTTKITELDNAFALCEPLGIQLLIDMHFTPKGHNSTNGLLIFYDQAANDKLVQAWQTLATRYKDRTGLYGYDLINEPLQFTTPLAGCDYKTTQQKVGNAIRQIDLKTPIFISVNNGDGPDGFNGFTPVNLTNVIYEVHMYQPHEYTQQLIPGGQYQTSYSYPGTIAGVSWNATQMTTVLGPVRNFQTNFSARIHVGEFSAARYAGGAATYLRDCMNIFEGYGWSWTYHAYREAKVWNLEYADSPVADNLAVRSTVPTDRYNQVVGWGLNLNQ